MKEAKVDVVIPVYNAGRWIETTLDSLLDQGDVLGQVICVDNNSSDQSCELISKWQAAHPEVDLTLTEERTPGACSARNLGLSLVHTEWVQFLDADDLLLPGKMGAQLSMTEGSDMVYGEIWFEEHGERRHAWTMADDAVVGLLHGRTGSTSCNLFRTEAVRAVDGWKADLSSAQEYDLMFRMFQAGHSFTSSKDRLTVMRLFSEGRISTGNEANRRGNSFELRMSMANWFLLGHGPALTLTQRQRILNALFNVSRWLDPWNQDHANKGFIALQKHKYVPTVDLYIPMWFVLLTKMVGPRRAARFRRKLANTLTNS